MAIRVPIITAPTSSLVTSTDAVAQLVNSLTELPVNSTRPSLYVDCRRKKSGDEHDISIFGLLVYPQNHVYLVDIDALGKTAFTMTGRGGQTLRAILESATVPKVFNAVSFSSLLLHARFGILLQGVQDMQILQWASRPGPLIYPIVNQRLGAAIKRDARVSQKERLNALTCYEAAARLFDSRRGGSLQVFGNRPLAKVIRAYCVHTLKYLPHLHNIYWNRVVELRREQLVANLTQKRLQFGSPQGSRIGFTSNIHFYPQRPIHQKFHPATLRKVLRR